MRAVTVRESEFNESDRVVLLASRWADDRPRGRHGLLLEETMDPANQFAFEATGAREDFAQSAVNKAQADHEKLRPKDDQRAFLFGVRRR